VQERAILRHGKGGNGAWHVLGTERCALERIDGDVYFRSGSGADLLANEQHRRFVHLAFADHHRAVVRKPAQFAAHGIDGGLV
jgi:hypothetical protein